MPVVCERAHVDAAGVATGVLREAVGVDFELVGLEVDLVFKDDELLLHAFFVGAHEVVAREVGREGVVVDVVLLLRGGVAAVADVAALVLVAAVREELVGGVEALATEPAFRVAFEAGLVFGAGLVVACALVLAELGRGEEGVLVGEDLLVARAEVAEDLVVDGPDVVVEVGPAAEGLVAGLVGAVVAEEERRVVADGLVVVLDAQGVVLLDDVALPELRERLGLVFGEDDPLGLRLFMLETD